MKVTRLEKTNGAWTEQEIDAITKAGAEVTVMTSKPSFIVLMNSLPNASVISAIGHSGFASEEVDHADMWKI